MSQPVDPNPHDNDLVLREIGANIVMMRNDAGRRVPRMVCGLCLKRVGPDARVIWNRELDAVAIPAVMVCSQACEELGIAGTEGVRRWSHMLLPELLIALMLGAGITTRQQLKELEDEIKNEGNNDGGESR